MTRTITRIALLAALTFLIGCETEQPETETVLRPVRYQVVEAPDEGRRRTFSGNSRSSQSSRLSFKVAGNITELPVEAGDRLSRGDLIAKLDPYPFELAAQQAQATLVQAEASQRNAKASYDRTKGLYENNNASKNDLDASRANYESSNAQVRAAQKALQLAELNVKDTVLTVDADCSVASVEAELNENVTNGGTVAVVNCGDQIEVGLSVPEGLISLITRDMPAQVSFDAVPGQVYEGRIKEIGVSTQGGAATFPVTVALDNPDSNVRPGLAAEVSLSFAGAEQQSITIPIAAVINDHDGTYVYLAVADGPDTQAMTVRRSVTLGELTEAGVQILDGLEVGDKVITAGVSVIRENQTVLLPK